MTAAGILFLLKFGRRSLVTLLKIIVLIGKTRKSDLSHGSGIECGLVTSFIAITAMRSFGMFCVREKSALSASRH